MIAVAGQPLIPLGLPHRGGVAAHIAHENTLEAREVAVHSLAHLDDTMAVGQVLGCPVHDGIGIGAVLLGAEVLVEHDCRTQRGSLVVGRRPGVAHGTLHRVAAVIHLSVEHTLRIDIVEQASLAGIYPCCLLEILLLVQGDTQIAGTHSRRAIDTGVGASVALLPYECSVVILRCTTVHAVEVGLGSCQIFGHAGEQIGSHACDAHPGNIVVELIIPAAGNPVACLAGEEVGVEHLKHGGILLVARCLERIKHHLKHLCIAPPAAVAYHITCAGLVVIVSLPLLHHIIAHFGSELILARSTFLHRPGILRRFCLVHCHQREGVAVGCIPLGGECITARGTGIDVVLVGASLHGYKLPAATGSCGCTVLHRHCGTGCHTACARQELACVGIGEHIGVGAGTLQHPSLRVGLRIGPHLGLRTGIEGRILRHDGECTATYTQRLPILQGIGFQRREERRSRQ